MKLVSETRGIEKLRQIRSKFAAEIRQSYEYKAKPCATCESPGICCRDEHYVNVRITRLEGAAIIRRLDELDEARRNEVYERVNEAIEKYNLSDSRDSFLKTYACPLFEKGVGCLVHDSAKPLPCIAHACYENEADLPPSEMLEEREIAVAELNRRVYGTESLPASLPVAVARARRV
jgi:hypothetical protein